MQLILQVDLTVAIMLVKCNQILCVSQVYAHLHVPITQHGLLSTGGQLCINQDPALPQTWTALPRSQHRKPEEDTSSEGQQLQTSDLDIADMV